MAGGCLTPVSGNTHGYPESLRRVRKDLHLKYCIKQTQEACSSEGGRLSLQILWQGVQVQPAGNRPRVQGSRPGPLCV